MTAGKPTDPSGYPTPADLRNRWVALEPLAAAHRDELRAAATDPATFAFTSEAPVGPLFDPWFDKALATAGWMRFAVRAGGRVVGLTGYLDIEPRHRRIEVGGTWYAPAACGTAVNPACKRLLLGHAFEVFGVNRVQLKTDVLNLRSQAAIAKLGATREGVLRRHMVMPDGRVRDTVLFALVADEWPAARAKLDERLAAFG